jgi:benzodiazapine receptor
MQRNTSDWAGNLAAFAIMILLNVLSNALPINGQSMPEISARYPSLFTPAGITFSIWGVIYLALLAFVIWQALPAQRSSEKLARISPWFKVNCLANALWLVVWHYDQLIVSMLVMLVMLVTLIRIYAILIRDVETAPFTEHLVLYPPFSLYTGWIVVATIANASVIQTHWGLDDVGMGAVQWTLLKLALAGAIGATMVLRFRDIPFALVIAWAAFGISVMQSGTPAVSGAATTLSLLMLFLTIRDGVLRLFRT